MTSINKTSDKNGKSLPVISLWNRAITANSEWNDKVKKNHFSNHHEQMNKNNTLSLINYILGRIFRYYLLGKTGSGNFIWCYLGNISI